MNCKHCSQPITDNAAFCPNCGNPIEKDIYERPSSTTYSQQLTRQGYSKYIFVVSLVLMIILVVNLITSFNSLDTLQLQIQSLSSSLTSTQLGLFNKMITLAQVETAFVFLNFALTLSLMIIAAMLRKKAKMNMAPQKPLLKAQFYLSIAAVAGGVIFVIYEIIVMQKLNSIAAELGVDSTAGISYLILPITFVGLLIPCIFKSLETLKNN